MIYIKRIEIDTEKLRDANSYVSDLPVLRNFSPIEIDSPVTFLSGKTEAENQH